MFTLFYKETSLNFKLTPMEIISTQLALKLMGK